MQYPVVASLLLTSSLAFALSGCRTDDSCTANGSNAVHGTLTGAPVLHDVPTARTCFNVVSGVIGTGGDANTLIQLSCTIGSGTTSSVRDYRITLGDPRTLGADSHGTLTIDGALPTDTARVRVELVSSAGASAPLPKAVSDDFARSVRVMLDGNASPLGLEGWTSPSRSTPPASASPSGSADPSTTAFCRSDSRIDGQNETAAVS